MSIFLYSFLKQNDIVFARTGASTGRNYFYDTRDGEFVYAGFLIKFSLDPRKVNPKYIKYYCQSDLYKNWIASNNTGSTRGNINAQAFGNMPITLPSRQQQDLLVDLLAQLDDKIRLNNKINENLEQQTDLIYTNIFCNELDFCELGNVVETTSGGTPSRKHPELYENPSIYWVKSKELNGSFIYHTEEMINEAALSKSSAKMLPSHSVLVAMYGATVGEYGIISSSMTCNQAICALIPNDKYSYPYLYELIRQSQEQLKNLAVGSAQQNISQVLIKKLPIHSNTQKIQQFTKATMASFQMREVLAHENFRLAKMRDTLLPKLMSGEIDVEDVKI